MEFERKSDENRTKITKVMENHRNYAELASKSHRIACIPAEFARKSHGIHRIFAWKSHRNHKNHGKPQKLFGIQPEFPRKSHENREKHGKSQKLRGTEFARNSSDFAWVRALGGTRRLRVGCPLLPPPLSLRVPLPLPVPLPSPLSRCSVSPSLASYTPPALASVPKTPAARRASELEFDNNTNIALNRKSRVLHGAPHGFCTAPPRNSQEIHTPGYTNPHETARVSHGTARVTRKSHGTPHANHKESYTEFPAPARAHPRATTHPVTRPVTREMSYGGAV